MSKLEGKYLLFNGTKGFMNHLDDHVHVYDGDVLKVVADGKVEAANLNQHSSVVSETHAANLLADYPLNFVVYNKHPEEGKTQPAAKDVKAETTQTKEVKDNSPKNKRK